MENIKYKLHRVLSEKGSLRFVMTKNKEDELLLIETVMNIGGKYIDCEEVGEVVLSLFDQEIDKQIVHIIK